MGARWSIRVWLLALVAAVALPLLVLLGERIYRTAEEAAQLEADASIRLANQTAQFVSRFLDDTRLALASMAQQRRSRLLEPAHCRSAAEIFVSANSMYANLVLRDRNDKPICAARGDNSINARASDPASFEQAIRENRFVTSVPLVGPITGRWVVILRQPVQNHQGRVIGVINLPIDLLNLQSLVSSAKLPAGGVVFIANSDGTILTHSVDADKWVGKNVRGMGAVDAVLDGKQGQLRGKGVDGVERVYGFATVASTGWVVVSGIPTEIIYSAARRVLFANSVLALAILLVAATLGVMIARHIAASIGRLAETARGVSASRAGIRSAINGPAEVVEVSKKLDRMLDAREHTEYMLRKSNRALLTISEINKSLVRAADEQKLLRDVCGILVGHGGYRMAWVGFVGADEAKTVRPAAQAGYEAGYLETVRITWADVDRGRGPTGTAIRTGKPSITRNILSDPLYVPWREDALKRGYASAAALPLASAGRVLGALNLYAAEPDAFDEAETELLIALANDLAYGIVSLRRLTQQEQAERDLRESESRLKLSIEASNIGLWDWDIIRDRVWFSPEWKRQLGYRDDELPNRFEEWESRLHPDDKARTLVEVQASHMAPWPPYETEFRLRHKDGSYRWIYTQAQLFRDANSRPERMLGCHIDITGRKQVETAWRESEARFRTIIEASPVPCALNDEQQNITYLNTAFVRTFGYDLTDIPTLAAWWPKAYPDAAYRQWVATAWQAHLDKARWTGAPFEELELNIRCKDGSQRTALVGAAPLGESFRGVHLVILHDITARKQSEEALRRYAEQMREMSRRLMESEESERRKINRELHDRVGQNLAALNLLLGMIGRELAAGATPAAAALLDDARKLVGTTTGEVRNLMTDLRPPALDDYGLVASLRLYAGILAERSGIEVAVVGKDLAPRPSPAAEIVLFRIAQEALSNVAKHARTRNARVTLSASGGRVTLVIADEGAGFDPGRQPNQASWGLTTMRERAEAVGASLSVDSAPGKGTRVTVKLEGGAR